MKHKIFWAVAITLFLVPTVLFAQTQARVGQEVREAVQAKIQPITLDLAVEAEEEAVFCTMDAKECPDGSYVGRVAPKCEFAPCPGEEYLETPPTDVVVSPRMGKSFRMQVKGEEVRGWSEEAKANVQERLMENSEKVEANNFGLFMARQAIENRGVKDIVVEENEAGEVSVTVEHRARLRFLGLFAREVPAMTKARVIAGAEFSGETETTYQAPWYLRWFSVKTDESLYKNTVRNLMNTLKNLSAETE